MTWEQEKYQLGREITEGLYESNFIKTVYNAEEQKFRDQGFILKNGSWSPWFLNLRPIGDAPELLDRIAYALALMMENEMPECNKIVGVEMAGIPIATATSMVSFERRGRPIPFCYTRPLPVKLRTYEEVRKFFEKERSEEGYGVKELVEGRLRDGDTLAIWDDMVTDFGSKLIAKEIVSYEVEKKGVNDVRIDHAGVLLDREQGATEEAAKFGMGLHSIIQFKANGLEWIKGRMLPEEYQLVADYLASPKRYQDPDVQKDALERAASLRNP